MDIKFILENTKWKCIQTSNSLACVDVEPGAFWKSDKKLACFDIHCVSSRLVNVT